MKFALTQPFPCSYLHEQQEQLLVLRDQHATTEQHYDSLLAAGFRRSGEHIYRPHCPQCSACEAIRIPVAEFVPSSSQKKVLRKNQDIEVIASSTPQESYYPLYARYIQARHVQGGMYPPSPEQYHALISSFACSSLFIEFHLGTQLLGVALTDNVPTALSALYTFFDPDCLVRSLGTFAILQQIALAKRLGKAYLYLGYQVDDCHKMNYKTKFLPHERFIQHQWHPVLKKHG